MAWCAWAILCLHVSSSGSHRTTSKTLHHQSNRQHRKAALHPAKQQQTCYVAQGCANAWTCTAAVGGTCCHNTLHKADAAAQLGKSCKCCEHKPGRASGSLFPTIGGCKASMQPSQVQPHAASSSSSSSDDAQCKRHMVAATQSRNPSIHQQGLHTAATASSPCDPNVHSGLRILRNS